MKIINDNRDIPVILLDDMKEISGSRNLEIDTSDLRLTYPDARSRDLQKMLDDTLVKLAEQWRNQGTFFDVEVYEGFVMTYAYTDSKEIIRLENERDSLIQSFNAELINNEDLVPVLLIDATNDSVIGTNIDSIRIAEAGIIGLTAELKSQNEPLDIDFKNGQKYVLYFDNSPELKQLQYFPYIIFFIIGLFVFIGYLIFSTFRKAEQNQVWAGMAKETAHQLGTPLSSLMAWIQYLESQQIDQMVTEEMHKDVDRLVTITDRFSKIGSGAKLEVSNLVETVDHVMTYLRPRISAKVQLEHQKHTELEVKHNAPLMEWVIENIVKNAVDAMEGTGKITVSYQVEPTWIHLDISDNGKGILPKQWKTIFQPGFSTKKRGWGLGLSLVKRIISEYHKGRVFVLQSEPNVKTTFRVSIPR
jgi:signal transduction histidine kinase